VRGQPALNPNPGSVFPHSSYPLTSPPTQTHPVGLNPRDAKSLTRIC